MTNPRYAIAVVILIIALGVAAVRSGRGPAPQQSDSSATLASVLTYHNDNARDGQNLAETTLTPANVKHPQFKRLFSDAVDGFIYAQPLYVPDVSISGRGTHNVVFVATENDSVYAFDAETAESPLWHTSFIDPSAGITTMPSSDAKCPANGPQFGITATPVIDAASGTIYVVANTKENGKYFQRLHALDISTGTEKFGGPVTLEASVRGTGEGGTGGVISFDPLQQHIRPGLLLANGLVYITSASHCDHDPWHGWVLAYNATSLARVAVLNTTPDAGRGGIWMSGGGPAADSDGNIFLATGNGTFDVNSGGVDYGDSYLKLNGTSLAVSDYFTPFNQATLNGLDLDLGSGGVLILPAQPGPHPDLLVGAGKGETIYLVNRDDMGRFGPSGDMVVQEIRNGAGASGCSAATAAGCVFDTAAYWQGKVYFAGHNDALKAFQLKNGLLGTTPVSKSTATFGIFGAVPAISANGATNGIVWVLDTSALPNGQAVLRAYNANNLSTELYDSNQAGTADQPGGAVRFSVPTIANGKVYVGTHTQLSVYGL
jgi:hypothetical protein